MSKLYFRHGTMNSTKTLQLLAVAHSYKSQGKTPYLIKPSTDKRTNADNDDSLKIWTRAGLSEYADLVVSPFQERIDTLLDEQTIEITDVILVDEVNFLTENQIHSLVTIVDLYNIPVICYGLKTDFKGKLFPGSKALLETADKVEEIKAVCHAGKCRNKAMFNMRVQGDQVVTDGDQIVVGDIEGETRYLPVCRKCYKNAVSKGRL